MKATIEIKIRGYHEDHFNHVNHARYLEFLEEARWCYLETYDLIENLFHKKGIFPAVVNINISYLRSAAAGDILTIETGIKKIVGRKVIMVQKIVSQAPKKLIVSAEISNIFIDTKTGKAVPIDDEMKILWPDLGEKEN